MNAGLSYDGVPSSVAGISRTYSQVQASFLCAALYGCLGSLPEEIDLIWKRRFTLLSWAYVIARYAGMVYLAVPVVIISVKRSDVLPELSSSWGKSPSEPKDVGDPSVFLMRVCAIYNNDRRLKWILGTLFLIEAFLVFFGGHHWSASTDPISQKTRVSGSVILSDVAYAVSYWYTGGLMEQYVINIVIFLEAVLGPRIATSLIEAHLGRNTVYLVPY
ncbi:hypothetical protein CONPUDRAFT_75744 [Coniophora puteana RWD-64-598 SS2]|uniref:DUF6533 domain-containing protein n=1 Tax=Coniophora puteana (strain RWD-64-598) TaxID=741705 RepID=A0A5M3MFF8_CONPW|nr:uncharacterized protein CONPUDRAFT_75744 [Coniophora puteana RWD-64-598 SS2]EIW77999.1 hypothetical protein CONPUDRAFT_75744 [Coniophora puteana RWD-64-598 SS2]